MSDRAARGHDPTSPAAPESAASGDTRLFALGERVSGCFEIRGVLGEGGMGRVYEAHDLVLNRRVAIKASWQHIDGDVLLNEARALASVRHPSIVSVYGTGEHRGIRYVVMERIYGTTLEDYLARVRAESGAVRLDEAVDILAPLAEVLGVLHRAGLAHRDVKPANVMLSPGGRVVLMDFGLFLPESRKPTGSITGTPRYLAPETIRGKVEPRTAYLVDVYALGVLAFELLTGHAPFETETYGELLRQHMSAAAPRVQDARADVPAELAELVDRMLAKDPLDRPTSMDAIAWALRQVRPPPAPKPFFVLIVEDDEAIAKMIERRVKSALPAADVARAKDAVDALDKVARRAPQLMLLDLHMPKMSGIELCMYLRGSQLAELCTIVAVSAAAREEDVALLRELGVTRVLGKATPGFGELLAKEVRAVYDAFSPLSRQ